MTTGAGGDLLSAIVAATRTRVRDARARIPASVLESQVTSRQPPRGFRAALGEPGLRVIAECKRRSPSRGVLRASYDPVAIARGYERAGAAALSVLTEPTFFDGAIEHLEAVRDTVGLPILRKDFIVDPYQLLEARAAGADAVLLIVAALEDRDLRGLRDQARTLGLDVLVEVHDEEELARAIDAGTDLVGVNNRNLKTLEVSLEVSRRLAPLAPENAVMISESGISLHEDLLDLQGHGFSGFLVGSALMREASPGGALKRLLEGTAA